MYIYDSNGNRLSMTTADGGVRGTYDARDRLLGYGTMEYAWTPNGELASKVDTATGAMTTYDYDALGNLRSVGMPDGGTIGYLLDGLNRRVGKTVNGVVAQQWVYQGQLQPVAEFSGNGDLESIFVYATHGNVPDLMIVSGTEYRVITDHLGSVVAVVNSATGEVAQQIVRDEWGNVLEDTNPGFQPFGFAGGMIGADRLLGLSGRNA